MTTQDTHGGWHGWHLADHITRRDQQGTCQGLPRIPALLPTEPQAYVSSQYRYIRGCRVKGGVLWGFKFKSGDTYHQRFGYDTEREAVEAYNDYIEDHDFQWRRPLVWEEESA